MGGAQRATEGRGASPARVGPMTQARRRPSRRAGGPGRSEARIRSGARTPLANLAALVLVIGRPDRGPSRGPRPPVSNAAAWAPEALHVGGDFVEPLLANHVEPPRSVPALVARQRRARCRRVAKTAGRVSLNCRAISPATSRSRTRSTIRYRVRFPRACNFARADIRNR